jgi:hypothetical protein
MNLMTITKTLEVLTVVNMNRDEQRELLYDCKMAIRNLVFSDLIFELYEKVIIGLNDLDEGEDLYTPPFKDVSKICRK